jgi:hypothetical protein
MLYTAPLDFLISIASSDGRVDGVGAFLSPAFERIAAQ